MQSPYLNPRSARLFNSKFNRESFKPPNNKNPFWICWSKNMTNRCKGTIRKTNKRNRIIRDGKGIPNKGFLNSCQEIRNSTNYTMKNCSTSISVKFKFKEHKLNKILDKSILLVSRCKTTRKIFNKHGKV